MTQRAYQESAQTLQQLNRELRAQTVELIALNKEFEAFSYSVSHDLRAPLRRVLEFSRAIIEDFADQADEKLRAHLARIMSGAEQMERLIEAMLSLSKLTRKELYHENVDLSEMAKNICAELKSSIPGAKASVSIAEGLRVQGDRVLLQAALGNLLANAFKFSRKRESPVIELGARREGGVTHYFVRDNGAGFDMRRVEKLFGVFQRLHSVDEFDGTGIGLATVKRIIERHAGKIWAEAEVDKGATFYFTLGEGGAE
jgi:light-regulated signal transduction histidine kinase (bacteriophytochrome)